MLKAKDFKFYAREALSGRWLKAGAVGLLAGILGAALDMQSTGSFNTGSGAEEAELEGMLSQIGAADTGAVSEMVSQIPAVLYAVVLGIALVGLIWLIVVLIVGGATTLGYAKYNLNLVDDLEPRAGDLFSQYNRLGTGFGMQFFRGLFIFLWSLLFVIPGTIASYRYRMTPFILCENPEMTAKEAIDESKAMMKGNKWRLFCLDFSFIGWTLLLVAVIYIASMFFVSGMMFAGAGVSESAMVAMLCVYLVAVIVICIVGTLLLTPYINAASAVFYREISEARYSNPHVEGETEEFTYQDVNQEPLE